MAKAKKFGAFAGVFTPSVLTILGVIMYMRLGWVVGNAGLITALVIIVISHVISLTTGLSISSVATDKKIKTGGIYYILSRSLGFPMGGAIGIALFVGTALGISLYLVGFSESLLAVDQIREFLQLEQDINSYRIIASASLLLLVTIAFISTSLAIKSQYFVLAAIAISIVSIVIGFFTNTHLAPETVSFTPARDSVDIQVIFGVFFPAVTGFTAGVAMSGDLRDPKKNIPVGTLSAIIVGFVIYIGLAVSFAVFVNRDLLINDYNFLLKIAWFSPLVLAGIWGATLSSALGGILGGPRILQAISKDKITPRIFAKGYGASNEPRNALIFIFLIAEGGILIGELNVIAGVVSMFYLASYGFINLAFFLENWASTDFRPTFKVKGVVGLIGFIASFAVMAQLGMLSMIASLVIMFGLFAWLNRKQLKSESGDVWQSVWMSVIRKALHSLDKKNLEDRNWQPNIILFSGGQEQRPHLIEFGKDLVGQYGLLSNFDLHESKDKKYLFPKHLQSYSQKTIEGKGVFTRKQSCSDIYTGIETIISTYGFSGIEPNTVIMGWMRQSKNPVRFSQMIKRIYELDVNLLLIDYDKKNRYGKYKTVDIWWRGSGNNGNFALNLIKLLWISENWGDAKLRLLVGNSVNENALKIKNHAEQVVSNMRINAEVKIINNQIEQKPFYELIRIESINTDLIILGMPEIKEGKEKEFVEKTNDLMHQIGTVVLIKASSQFKDLSLGLKYKLHTQKEEKELNSIISGANKNIKLILPESPIANEKISSLNNQIQELNTEVIKENLNTFFVQQNNLTNNIINDAESLINERIIPLINNKKKNLHLLTGLDIFIKKTFACVQKFNDEPTEIQEESLDISFNKMIAGIEQMIEKLPEYFYYSYNEEDLKYKEDDKEQVRKFKKKMRQKTSRLNSGSVQYKVKYKKLINLHLPYKYFLISQNCGELTGTVSIRHIIEIQKLIRELRNSVLKLQRAINNKRITDKIIKEEISILKEKVSFLKKISGDSAMTVYNTIQYESTAIINNISDNIKILDVNKITGSEDIKNNNKISSSLKEYISNIPSYFKRNQKLLINSWKVELLLTEFENKLLRITEDSFNSFDTYIKKEVLSKIINVKGSLSNYLNELIEGNKATFIAPEFSEIPDKGIISKNFKLILDNKFEKLKYLIEKFPKKINLLSNDSYNDIIEKQFSEVNTVEINVSSFIEYIIQTKFNAPLTKLAEELPEDIIDIENNTQNILRLVTFSLFDSERKTVDNEINTTEKAVEFINKQIEVLEQTEKRVIKITDTINRKINERLSDLSNHLSLYSVINEAGTSFRFSKIYSKKKNSLKAKMKHFADNTNSIFNNLWYRQSEAVLLRKEIINSSKKDVSQINAILDLLEKVSVSNETLKKLPFYYKQLFLNTGNYSNEFFTGRHKELNEINKAFNRYKIGYNGAILINGDRYSGKTFFTNYSVSKFFPNTDVYKISPPPEGSVSLKTFRTKIAVAFDAKGSYDLKFSNIKKGSIIIFDEFELWWEKSETGFVIIDEVINLIETYGNRFIFIININTDALKLINKIKNIEAYFLNIIECKAFNASELKEAIMLRHNAGGLQLSYKGKFQDKIRQFDYAKLFVKHFNNTRGNIGTALSSWLSNIDDVKESIIYLNSFKIEKSNLFENFDTDINIILVQFILHKRLNISKLSRILLEGEDTIEKKLSYLKRSGIISEISKGVFELNQYLYIYIKDSLEQLEMI
ncbi:MAG: hypothetical protein K8R54_09480 [Bacteroidales bacterium]|nr:hypothetical protein [Bacteroidales bacterium]